MLRRVLTGTCGTVIALVLGLIGQQIDRRYGFLVLLGPGLLGGLAGFALTRCAIGLWESYDLRDFPRRETLLTAVGFGLAGYASMFLWDYMLLLSGAADQAAVSAFPGMPVGPGLTTRLPFWHYLQLRMQAGMTLYLGAPGGTTVTGAAVGLLWLVEAVAAAYGAYLGYRRAMRPHQTAARRGTVP